MDTKKKSHIKVVVFLGVIVLILILNHRFGWSRYMSDMENLEFLKQMMEEHRMMAILIYIAITIVSCVFLALPGVTFAILAGLLFGPVLGTVCCCIATTAGAILAFLLGRFFLKDTIKPLAMKNKYLKKWLFDSTGTNELFVLMLTRLIPLFPYNLQNFAYGVTDIRFSTYSIGSFLFMIPGTAMYTIGTAGLVGGENRILYLAIAVILAVLVIGLGKFFQKKYL